MARRCDVTGKGVQAGNNVSHANNKTRRRYLPNLNSVTLISDTLRQSVRVRISAHGLKSVDHNGGLDAYLLKTSDSVLSTRMRKLKHQIAKRRAAEPPAA